MTDRNGDNVWRAELYRVRGDLLLLSDPDGLEAETWFLRAIETAREQHAKSLELRAMLCLARLRWQRGNPAAARGPLAEIYGWFTEGLDTPDLREAASLLEQLQLEEATHSQNHLSSLASEK